MSVASVPTPDAFPATRWSQVVAAGAQQPVALEDLCRAYWYPLYVFVRRRGYAASDAECWARSSVLTQRQMPQRLLRRLRPIP
jgi:hypothetical protein